MIALLLAAGRGERLRPLTDALPKCLLPVAGKSSLVRAIEGLRDQGVTDLIVNLHYRAQAVLDALGDGSELGVKLGYSYEPSLRGTGGALDACRARFSGARFLVRFADVIVDFDLDELVSAHKQLGAALTMTLQRRDDARSSGLADVDDAGRIRAFIEKPIAGDPLGGWVNSGVVVCEPAVLDAVPAKRSSDLGRDVIPTLLASGATVGGLRLAPNALHLWIDTPADLARADSTLRELEAT